MPKKRLLDLVSRSPDEQGFAVWFHATVARMLAANPSDSVASGFRVVSRLPSSFPSWHGSPVGIY